MLVGGGSGDGGDDDLQLGAEATAATATTAAPPAPSSPSPPPPPPTSLQFPAAATVKEVKSSRSASPVESKAVIWPESGEKFWERSSGGGVGKAKAGRPVSSPPNDSEPNDDFIVHIAAELAPRAKVGGLGDGKWRCLSARETTQRLLHAMLLSKKAPSAFLLFTRARGASDFAVIHRT